MLTSQPTMHFADIIKDKGSADEKIFFNQSDQKALKKLLKKMKTQTDTVTSQNTVETAEKDLEKLIKKFNIKASPTLIGDLLQWKYD